jgi:hypothetical protein
MGDAADDIAARIRELALVSGAGKVHVIAHSLGGIALRSALFRNPDLAGFIASGTTIGTPHNGTPWAHRFFHWLPLIGGVVSNLEPGSDLLTLLNTNPHDEGVRWTCVWSREDEVVPGDCGKLYTDTSDVTYVRVDNVGHAGLMHNNRVTREVVNKLVDADEKALCDYVDQWESDARTRRTKRELRLPALDAPASAPSKKPRHKGRDRR